MSRLVIVVPDLYPARLTAPARRSLPRLPALEQWLGAARAAPLRPDWRHWLLGETWGGAHRSGSLGAVAAAAVADLPPAAHRWLATPVHLVAGLDTVRLHPAGLLRLEAAEQQALSADFARVFAGSGWSLHATGRRELLLCGGDATGVHSSDPALWLGAAPSAGLVSGPGATALRRLGGEIELWLHEQPINRQRQERGALPATGLWPWGGGAPLAAAAHASTNAGPGSAGPGNAGADNAGAGAGAAAPVAAGAGRAYASDLFVAGLWRLGGMPIAEPPVALQALPHDAGTDTLVVCEFGGGDDAAALAVIERDWLVPALAQWRAGAWQTAVLLLGTRALGLRPYSPWSFWRSWARPRAWWESVLEC